MPDRANLDFLLGEMDRWRAEGRVPGSVLAPLVKDYRARRAALDAAPPLLAAFDLSDSPAPPTPQPTLGERLTAFLEARNIAVLHVVGSLLLLAGLVALVRWQWAAWGRGVLLLLVAGLTVGFTLAGEKMATHHPLSARVARLLGALLLSLNAIALNVLVLHAPWPLVALVTAAACGAVYLWEARRTGDSVYVPLAAASGAAGVAALAAVAPGAWQLPIVEAGWLALAGAFFFLATRLRTEWRPFLLGSGHALLAGALGAALLHTVSAWPNGNARAGAGLVALVAAGIYGALGVTLRLPGLAWAASLAAFVGVQLLLAPHSNPVWRGAASAATGFLLALAGSFRRPPETTDAPRYRAAGLVLTALSLVLLLVFLEGFRDSYLALAAPYLLLTVLWAALAARPGAQTADTTLRVYAASGLLIGATRVLGEPFDAWFVRVTGLAPEPTRWLLVTALGLALAARLAQRENVARGLRGAAAGGAAWAGVVQLPLLFDSSSQATAGIGALLLLACGLAAWSPRHALLPLAAAYGTTLFRHGLGEVWAVPLVLLAAALAAVGTLLRRTDRDKETGSALLVAAAGHAAATLLPAPLRFFWPVATLPVLLWAGNAPLCAFVFGAFLLDLAQGGEANAPALLAVTTATAGGALWLSRLTNRAGVALAAGIAATGTVLTLGGFPVWSLPASQTGFALAVIAAVYLAGSVVLAPRHASPSSVLSDASLVLCGLAGVVGLVGVFDTAFGGAGTWSVVALLVVGVLLAVQARLRQKREYAHGSFTAFYTAFLLYAYGSAGMGVDRLDVLLLPLGLYLLLVGERSPGSVPPHVGMLFLLGPSLLGAWLEPNEWGHAFLLVAECVVLVIAGIFRRVRAYLAGGIGFLLALLALKTWDPLRQVNFGVYLTLLGVLTLAAAVYFERRRERALALVRAARGAFNGWR